MPATVSINLCCYNAEKYLREALDSVVNQTYTDWELVIINDGSTDSTETIIKEYINRGVPIFYYYQENHGLGYSRNEALKYSSGKYIAFLDQDDIWLPEKLKAQVLAFEADPEIDLIYTNYYLIRGKNKTLKFKFKQPEGSVVSSFLGRYPVHISTAMVRRTAIERLDHFFDPNLQMTEDYDFCMRILFKSKVKYLHQPLATYRYHATMSSVKQELRLIRETIQVLQIFAQLFPGEEYLEIIKRMIQKSRAGLAFRLSKDELSKGNQTAARKLISPYKYLRFKLFIFYVLLCLPTSLIKYFWASFVKKKGRLLS